MSYHGDITALMVAKAREIVSGGEQGFVDPFAGELVAAAGGFDIDGFPQELVDRIASSVLLRSMYLDAAIREGIDQGARQVVLLGSGLDARPWRMGWPVETRAWMLDLPGTAGLVESVLGDAPIADVTSVTTDLRSGSWTDDLRRAGFDEGVKTVWVAEGLLFYLSSRVSNDVVARAGDLSSRGSRFAFAHFGPGSENEAMTRRMSTDVETYGGSFVSTIRSPEHFLADTPWGAEKVSTLYREARERDVAVEYAETPGNEVTWLCSAAHQG